MFLLPRQAEGTIAIEVLRAKNRRSTRAPVGAVSPRADARGEARGCAASTLTDEAHELDLETETAVACMVHTESSRGEGAALACS